jgi:TPR repeat protein
MTEFEQTKELAGQGDAEAQYNLGWMYKNGKFVKQDYALAVRWYTNAAEQGHVKAREHLGMMYAQGQGVNRGTAEAMRGYINDIKRGHAEAKSKADELIRKVDGEHGDKSADQDDASEKNDPISPNHYKQGDIECIDAIRAMTSSMHGDGFKIACLKDVVKYVWRHEFKDGLQDLKKARWYLDKAIKQLEKENANP